MTATEALQRAKHCERMARDARTYDSAKAWREDAKEWRRQATKLAETEKQE